MGCCDMSGYTTEEAFNQIVEMMELVGGLAAVGETMIIPSGYKFLIEFVNVSGADTTIAIKGYWWENGDL